MGDIKIPDSPSFNDNFSWKTAKPVRYGTLIDFADCCNWLNLYARRVYPFQNFNHHGRTQYQFIYPVDGANYTQRYLTVVILYWVDSVDDAVSQITLKSSANTTGVTESVTSSSRGQYKGLWTRGSNKHMSFQTMEIEIDGGKSELIDVSVSSHMTISGIGAWELPPGCTKYAYSVAGGVARNKAVASSTTHTESVDIAKFYPGATIESTDLNEIQDAVLNAKEDHRRIIYACGATYSTSDYMNWHTSSPTNAGSFVRLPVGGIYVPPTTSVSGNTDVTVNVSINIKHGSENSGQTQWRIYRESDGATSSTSTQTVVPGTGVWLPQQPASATVAAWDNTAAALTIDVPATGDWIFIELKEATTEKDDPYVNQIVVWEDGT